MTPQEIVSYGTPDGYALAKLGMKLHPKQAAVLRDLFKPKSRVVLRCGNEVGKTASVATIAILYAVEMLGALVVSTAGSWNQVVNQLVPNLKRHALKYPGWEFNEADIKVGNERRYIGFSPSDEGRAQGFHASATRPLLVIVDEAAAVPEGTMRALEDRVNPTWMLVMGSPLDPVGAFYDMETKLAKFYQHHHVSQMDCLVSKGWWIKDSDVERKIAKNGKEHPFIMSNVFGEFCMKVDNALISLREFQNCIDNPPIEKGESRCAFVDVAGGGDKNVFAVRKGNRVWIEKRWRDTSEMATVGEIVGIIKKLEREIGLRKEEVWIDAGGAGKPMADRLREVGCELNRFFGQSAAMDDEYGNAVAEVWGSAIAKIKKREVIIPDDEDFRMQVLSRTMSRRSTAKFYLESKEDLKKRGLQSPDEADAILGAIALNGSIGGNGGSRNLFDIRIDNGYVVSKSDMHPDTFKRVAVMSDAKEKGEEKLVRLGAFAG
jgi:phage terminase large subunit